MSKGKAPAGAPRKKGLAPKRSPKLLKRATNLTLDPAAVSRGERFGEQHGTSLSQLVTRFLLALGDEDDRAPMTDLTPSVRRLYGAAASGGVDRRMYLEYLHEKYGTGR